MRKTLLTAVLMVLALAPTAVSGQHAMPVPLDAEHPRAERAGELAKLLLAGSQAGVEAYLKSHGEARWLASARRSEEVSSVLSGLANAGYTVADFMAVGEELVIVRLSEAGQAGASQAVGAEALAIGVAAAAPYSINRVARAKLQIETH